MLSSTAVIRANYKIYYKKPGTLIDSFSIDVRPFNRMCISAAGTYTSYQYPSWNILELFLLLKNGVFLNNELFGGCMAIKEKEVTATAWVRYFDEMIKFELYI